MKDGDGEKRKGKGHGRETVLAVTGLKCRYKSNSELTGGRKQRERRRGESEKGRRERDNRHKTRVRERIKRRRRRVGGDGVRGNKTRSTFTTTFHPETYPPAARQTSRPILVWAP